MAKFNFKLQSLLNIKEKFEEQSKIEYGKAIALLEEEKTILLELTKKKENNIIIFRKMVNEKINPIQLNNVGNFLNHIDEKIEEQNIVINKAKNKVEEKRILLLECMKEKKALETLKEKQKEFYFKEELKIEQKIIDEIVSYKYNKG